MFVEFDPDNQDISASTALILTISKTSDMALSAKQKNY